MEFKYDVIVIGAGHARMRSRCRCCKPGFEDLSYHNGYEQNRTDEL
mgnify:CR=1 FL=1